MGRITSTRGSLGRAIRELAEVISLVSDQGRWLSVSQNLEEIGAYDTSHCCFGSLITRNRIAREDSVLLAAL